MKLDALSSLELEADPVVLGSTLRNRGSQMFIRYGLEPKRDREASSLCNKIQKLHQPCLVLRN